MCEHGQVDSAACGVPDAYLKPLRGRAHALAVSPDEEGHATRVGGHVRRLPALVGDRIARCGVALAATVTFDGSTP
jgi:hypothetical protein